jgi:L-2-hydroxyglutarate oxidase LhgO
MRPGARGLARTWTKKRDRRLEAAHAGADARDRTAWWGIRGLDVPGAGITDYAAVCERYAEIVGAQRGAISTGTEVSGLVVRNGQTVVETTREVFATRYVINCAGLHSDRVARMAAHKPAVRIVPFRGEYYDLIPRRPANSHALLVSCNVHNQGLRSWSRKSPGDK